MTDDSATGRRIEDIEITPEMIAAGAAVVRAYDSRFEDEEGVAEEVFRQMLILAK